MPPLPVEVKLSPLGTALVLCVQEAIDEVRTSSLQLLLETEAAEGPPAGNLHCRILFSALSSLLSSLLSALFSALFSAPFSALFSPSPSLPPVSLLLRRTFRI